MRRTTTVRILSALVTAATAVATISYGFVVMGDYGNGSRDQIDTAGRLNLFCRDQPDMCRSVYTVGDTFYDGPNTTTDRARWWDRFSALYTMGKNDASFKWYAIMGNHDYEGSLDAYMNFHNDSRWQFNTNYSVSPAGSDATFVFLDTNRAVSSYLSPPYGDCREYCAEQLKRFGCTPTTVQDCWTKHLDWAASALAAATTRWKFVLGHHPIDNTDLMTQLAPVLEKHGAQAYFSGHIHNLQHAASNGVQYFVSGAGGFSAVSMEAEAAADAAKGVIHGASGSHLPRLLTCPEGASCYPMLVNFAADGPGYLTMALNNTATPHTATATFYAAGKVVYSATFSA